MNQLNTSLETQAKILGVDLFGVTSLKRLDGHTNLLPKSILNRYYFAISIGYVIPSTIILNSTKDVFHHFLERTILPTLDRTSIYLSRIIEKKNGKAFPIPAYNYLYGSNHPYYFHDLVASYAGIGWLGKNSRLVNKNHGSRIQTTTILTDIDLDLSEISENLCNECTICVDSCPQNALTDIPFHPEHDISDRLDANMCLIDYHNDHISNICIKCLNTCPYNK